MGLLWMGRREAGWEWTPNARVGGEGSNRAGIGGPEGERRVTAFPSCGRRSFSGSVLEKSGHGSRRGGKSRARLTLVFPLADVDRVELEPASNRKRLAANDGHVLESIDAIELAARVQHRLLVRSDTTLGAP